ncbi:VOC family protein [Dyadobacter subterraneus]|uniref:VOC family protein n=1 Tax=Dyadobacter subterraneus TaxID=2773304 RepID=A0ABR9W4G6_9BACT|nr:VOC family protein [Dyadobacter subterraneus]MBE9460342.1 VOC family protein [Dyadobacter subterraneus]
MSTIKIPNGHQTIMPYLMLESAEKFIDFTTKVFSAEVTFKKMRDDTDVVMHSEIRINGSTIMFCDSTEKWKTETANLFIYVEDADESYQKALSEGATTIMEPADQDYGRSCGVTDPSGNVWWVTSVK